MTRVVVPSLLLMALLAIACGPRTRSPDTEEATQAVDATPDSAHLDVRVQDRITFTFRVTNNEPGKVELMFPSGQTHDFVVVDSTGQERWRWSADRMFTQVVLTRVLEASASLSWDAECGIDLPAGHYTAVAQLKSENRPMEQRVAFEVR